MTGPGSALVGIPLKVGNHTSEPSENQKLESGKYQVTITDKFSDNTSQVLYTGSVDVVGSTKNQTH